MNKETEKEMEVCGKTIQVHGPYYQYSAPYGKALPSMDRNQWFISRKLTEDELKDPKTSEISKILKTCSLGVIVRYCSDKRRYIISQLFPAVTFTTLDKAIEFLVKNEGKLVFCS